MSESATASPTFPLDAWSIAALLLVLGLAVWAFRIFKQRMDEQRYREQLADLEFEANLFGGSTGIAEAAANDAVFLQEGIAVAGSEAPLSSSIVNNPPSPVVNSNVTVTRNQLPADAKAETVVEKLKQAALLQSVEGYIELHGNTQGAAILRLRNGKSALLVPHMESEAFIIKNAKRVDMIIMVGTNGNAFVVGSLEELIAESARLR